MKRFSWLVRPRTIWAPTLIGWALLLSMLAAPFVFWGILGEPILCVTRRESTDILVVEGWGDEETLEAAAAEFKTGNYRWAVTTGGPNGENWQQKRWTYAQIAFDRLAAYGVAKNKIIMAPAPEVESQRTYTSALSAKQALADAGLRPNALNLFTRGSHARRSQLVYAKVFEPTTKVGAISWLPDGAHKSPWWKSTVRAKDMLTETIGYLYEALLDSGRSDRTASVTSLDGKHQQP